MMTPKFRVWDKNNKKMVKVKSIHFMEDKEDFNIVINPLDFISSEHVVLMQATSLQDKRAMDIYEGDIFKHETGVEYAVVFESGMFGFIRKEFFDWKNRRYIEVLEPLRSANNYGEIVGNIYENPNLLEEQSC